MRRRRENGVVQENRISRDINKKKDENKEGAASLADDLTEKLSVGEKKEDVPTPEKKKDEPEAEASSAEKEKKDEQVELGF